MQNKLIIYTDGGSRGNPGPAAIGVVIENGQREVLKKYGEKIGEKTNNEAEYEAIIFALKKAKQLFGKEKTKKMNIDMYMDSELVASQLSGKYKIEEERLFPYFIKIWNLKFDFGKITFNHILRNKNKEADRMLNEALDSNQQSSLL
ncbi:ribonuclease HI family protein [Patescibacteria group bacterium]